MLRPAFAATQAPSPRARRQEAGEESFLQKKGLRAVAHLVAKGALPTAPSRAAASAAAHAFTGHALAKPKHALADIDKAAALVGQVLSSSTDGQGGEGPRWEGKEEVRRSTQDPRVGGEGGGASCSPKERERGALP